MTEVDRNIFTASAGTHFELMREFEKGRKVAEKVGDRYCTEAGDPYVVINGIGDENDARAAFATYAEGRNGMLYWRVPPETGRFLFKRNLHPGERYFYMRLFIEKD